MGSTATIYGVVALAVALICLLIGFLWGRSNAKAKVERAVEQEHTALDAREFAMRQQLDDAMAEVARFRPLAEELGRVQERLRIEQAKYEQMKTEFSATLQGESAEQKSQVDPQQPSPIRESADEQIHKLLQSLEQNFNSPAEEPLPIAEVQTEKPKLPPIPETKPVVHPAIKNQPSAPPVATPKPAVPMPEKRPAPPQPAGPKPPAPLTANPKPAIPKPATPQPATPKPATPQAAEVDEWQEFARSLASLTERKK